MSGARVVRPGTGYALVAGAAVSWGTWSLFFRPAERLGPLPAATQAFIVMAVVGLVNLPMALARTRQRALSGNAWLAIVLMGVADAGNILLFFGAMRKTTLAVAVLSHSLAPLFVAALSPLVTREPFRARTLVATGVGLLGLALLLEPWRSPGPSVLLGAAAGAGSAVFYAGNVLTQKRIGGAISPSEILAYHAPPACVLLYLALPDGGLALAHGQAPWLLAGAVGPGALAALAFVAGLGAIPASHAAVLALLEPLVAVLLSVLVWGEAIRPLGVVGGLVVLAAVAATITGPAAAPAPVTRS